MAAGVLVLLLGIGGAVLALSGGDAESVQEVADQAVEAAEDLDVDAGIDLLCEKPTAEQQDELEELIEGAREESGTDDPDVSYEVSDVPDGASGTFDLRVTSDEEGLDDAELEVVVVVEAQDGRSCIAGVEDPGNGEEEVVGEEAD